MSNIDANKSSCAQFAEGIAKAYVRAIAQKANEYAQPNFQCAIDDFLNSSLGDRTAEVLEGEEGPTQAIKHSSQNLGDMIAKLNEKAASFMTANITTGKEFSNAMYEVLKKFYHSQSDDFLGGKEEFYQAFRTEMDKSREETRLDGGTQNVQPGVIETLGANPELEKIKGDAGFLEKVRGANPKNIESTCFKIGEGGQIQPLNQGRSQDIVPLDPGFINAAQKQATQGDIVIMCGVNPDSLGDKGVLAHPDRYAPKPMTCHAKSSYFGFTKGLVPVNPKFSRHNIAIDQKKEETAEKDVQYSKEHGGQEYHLKVSIDGDTDGLYPVYQGEFSQNDAKYRFQVAVPAEIRSKSEGDIKNWVQEAINGGNVKSKLDSKFFECGQDNNGNVDGQQQDGKKWKIVNLESLNKVQGRETINIENFEPTLVLGPQKNSERGPQKESGESASTTGENDIKISSAVVNENTDKERYYVSDYDVFAIAHRDSQSVITKTSNVQSNAADGAHNRYELLGKFGGEVADPADVATINAINAQLLGYEGNADSYVKEYQNKDLYDTIRTFQPIQHAAAATLHFNNPAANPAYPLFAIEEDHVIEIKDHKALAAYLYCLENLQHGGKGQQTCLINSALSNILAGELVKLS